MSVAPLSRRTVEKERGFTLAELLIVGVALSIFVGLALILVRPQNYDVERRNAERRLELAHIMQAISRYEADTGKLPPNIPAEEAPIATEDDGESLCDDLVPTYVDDLPHDPQGGLALEEGVSCISQEQVYLSGYTARLDGTGNVVLAAPAAENGEAITVEKWFPVL